MIGRLPKPPLAEVVFEMRWAVVEGPTLPLPFDPAYPQLLDAFSAYAKGQGFSATKEMQPPYFGLPKSISRRFYKSDDASFPLLQIGPGVLAVNESVNYEWPVFKKMAVEAAVAVVANFPKLQGFGLTIEYLELRYIDTFDQKFIGDVDFVGFINEATTARLEWPSVEIDSARKFPAYRGRLHIENDLRRPAGAAFFVDIASAKKADDTSAIRMETKVFSKGQDIIPAKSDKRFSPKLSEWMECAHDATSESFKRFIRPMIFEKFNEQ